jgi:hypothetical protein
LAVVGGRRLIELGRRARDERERELKRYIEREREEMHTVQY